MNWAKCVQRVLVTLTVTRCRGWVRMEADLCSQGQSLQSSEEDRSDKGSMDTNPIWCGVRDIEGDSWGWGGKITGNWITYLHIAVPSSRLKGNTPWWDLSQNKPAQHWRTGPCLPSGPQVTLAAECGEAEEEMTSCHVLTYIVWKDYRDEIYLIPKL